MPGDENVGLYNAECRSPAPAARNQPEEMSGVSEKLRQPLSFLDCLFIPSL